MNGRVTTDKLNVRSYPNRYGRVIGTLPRNSLVTILDQKLEWYEVRYEGASAFVHSKYVDRIHAVRNVKGRIKASILNVRGKPQPLGDIIGTLQANAIVDIVAEAGEWYEISLKGAPAYVYGEYVELIESTSETPGVVTASVLNVRKRPDAQSEIIGKLVRDSIVRIQTRIGPWCQIPFGGEVGYIHGDHVSFTAAEETGQPFVQESRLRETATEPERKLTVQGSKEARRAATTWNQFGALLPQLCDRIGIDVACAVAVLCVESGGEGFRDGRMVIRFENHQFWKWWGRYRPDDFHRHFQYAPEEPWQKHQFRLDERTAWTSVHASQNAEWRVLEFARTLDDSAALKSISMGAPQIMGFNHEKIGYETVQHMFSNFTRDVRFHIMGLFDFFDNNMIQALKAHDFSKFAKYYNGPGQAEAYGGWIEDHYEAFKQLRV